ncbi:hypothetical protein CKO36_18995 [Rhabdochromatium marinum]|nr:alpha/beta hydrolase [Rhabdochromatium marinum]MBK1650582.1 hypothetical protein [Rhabdochromatium marinum]
MAHSMGSRVLANAVKSIEIGEVKLNQVVLAAPDINSKIFVDHIAPFFKNKAERYSIYSSSKDRALEIANEVQKSHRLGQSGKNMVVLQGFDTIDASAIDTSVLGHSYYGDERELLFDLYHLLRNNLPPDGLDHALVHCC